MKADADKREKQEDSAFSHFFAAPVYVLAVIRMGKTKVGDYITFFRSLAAKLNFLFHFRQSSI